MKNKIINLKNTNTELELKAKAVEGFKAMETLYSMEVGKNQVLTDENNQLENKIKENSPKVKAYDDLYTKIKNLH